MRSCGWSAAAVLIVVLPCLAREAYAQVTCAINYVQAKQPKPLGFSPNEVERLVSDVATAIGLSPRGISIIPCDGVGKVQSIYFNRKEVPQGDYIFYDPVWVREVLGNKLVGGTETRARDQAVVIFGHELGHLLGRHFTSNIGLTSIQKETEADHFAGCAASVMNVDWNNVQDILRRIRPDTDTDYPSQAHSLEAARSGYDICRKSGQGVAAVATTGSATEIATAWQQVNQLDNNEISKLALRSQTFLRTQGQLDSIEPVVTSLAAATEWERIKSLDDPTRRSLYVAVTAVPPAWWNRPDASRSRETLRFNLIPIDSVVNQAPRSIETTRALEELKRQLGYAVPPGRIVSAGPFRTRLDYCPQATCSYRIFLRGYDERGNLRLIKDAAFSGLRQGDLRDTTLESNARMYFEVDQQLVNNRSIAFRVFCKYEDKIIPGDSTEIRWSAAQEVSRGYATWLSCKDPKFQASIGISVNSSPDRANEPSVVVDPGPPR